MQRQPSFEDLSHGLRTFILWVVAAKPLVWSNSDRQLSGRNSDMNRTRPHLYQIIERQLMELHPKQHWWFEQSIAITSHMICFQIHAKTATNKHDTFGKWQKHHSPSPARHVHYLCQVLSCYWAWSPTCFLTLFRQTCSFIGVCGPHRSSGFENALSFGAEYVKMLSSVSGW